MADLRHVVDVLNAHQPPEFLGGTALPPAAVLGAAALIDPEPAPEAHPGRDSVVKLVGGHVGDVKKDGAGILPAPS